MKPIIVRDFNAVTGKYTISTLVRAEGTKRLDDTDEYTEEQAIKLFDDLRAKTVKQLEVITERLNAAIEAIDTEKAATFGA